MLSVPDIRLSREVSLADRKVIGNKVRAVASGQVPPSLAVHGFHSHGRKSCCRVERKARMRT